MAVKNMSTRLLICGRGDSCKGGHSAVEKSAYIARETMYCEYDGKTYYPKYSEDLVHSEVMLPVNAPERYKDPSVLWNEVELFERGDNAQLARTFRVTLPNEWSYELATEVMRDYIKRNFVDRGMCAQFAIHDSENKTTGQRNLHCHMMFTLRGIDDKGHWMAKQRKEYLRDENGERIPLIDKETGQQKVDKQNRKQWKCTTVPVNDWNSKENARRWREDLANTINAVNERTGISEDHWEHRSFKEQGLDILPQIHLGEKASALERAGVHTVRGDMNRKIMASNAIIEKARAAYEQAKEELQAIRAIPSSVISAIKNEILDMIREVSKRNNERLRLPILKGRYLPLVSNRAVLQDKDSMESFVHNMGWTTFEDMKAFKDSQEMRFGELSKGRHEKSERIAYLEGLLDLYRSYEPFIKNHKEQWALKGFERKKYERQHITELSYYESYRNALKSRIVEADKRILPKVWKKELDTLRAELQETQKPYADLAFRLAGIEVISYNRKELARMLENESRQKKGDATIQKDKENQSL